MMKIIQDHQLYKEMRNDYSINKRYVQGRSEEILSDRVTIIDIYNSYERKNKPSKKVFKNVLLSFNYILMKDIIDNGTIYHLPKKLGLLYIGRSKTRDIHNRKMDMHHYMKTGEKVYFTNKHSLGYTASFKWDKHDSEYFQLYARMRAYFTPLRGFKRYLAKCIKEHNTIQKYIIHE